MKQKTPAQQQMLEDKRAWLARHSKEILHIRRGIAVIAAERIFELVRRHGDGTAWPRDDIVSIIEDAADELSRFPK